MSNFSKFSEHISRVNRLQSEIKKRKGRITLNFSSNHALRDEKYKKEASHIDISNFNHLIDIDVDKKIAIVEPKITFENLCKLTLKKGVIPLVVPEFKTITVGGAITGAALESSSFKYGEFFDSCLEIEVILGNGEVLRVSKDQYSDLFFGLSGSLGTLGIITLIKIKLKDAEKNVKLEFQSFPSVQEFVHFFHKKKEENIDFFEGVMVKPNKFIACVGKMTPTTHCLHQIKQKNFWDPWFYRYFLSSPLPEPSLMSLSDYLFRFDRGAFWMGSYLTHSSSQLRLLLHINRNANFIKNLKMHLPSKLFLALWGWGFSSKNLYRLWHKVPHSLQKHVFFVQDYYVPLENAKEAIDFLFKKTSITPFWLCPLKGSETAQIFSPRCGISSYYLDIGVYGKPSVAISALLAETDKFVFEMGGRKMLYAPLSEEIKLNTFYDFKIYEILRNKYFAINKFPSIEEKIKERLF